MSKRWMGVMVLSVLFALVAGSSVLGGARSSAAGPCQCVAYVRCATGIDIYGNGNQWDDRAPAAGYRVSSSPRKGAAMNFEAGAYGADPSYGHVGKVMAYQDLGTSWKVLVRHANWYSQSYLTDCGCSNVSETWFTVKKNDGLTHFISGANGNQQRSLSGNRSFESYNYPGRYVRHYNFLGELTPISTGSTVERQDATFRVVPGLANSSCVSLESQNYRGFYLRHQGFRITLQRQEDSSLYRKDATFCIRPGLANTSYVSLESYNYPGYYLRHRDFHLYLETGSTSLFRGDATFKAVAPLQP